MFVADAGARRSCCHARRRLCYVVAVGSAGRTQRRPLGAWRTRADIKSGCFTLQPQEEGERV
ncbi:hypothetical protein A2U01_0083529, partial [Trifolium medium]|nr:hypothetical protein [Trifolium medium]